MRKTLAAALSMIAINSYAGCTGPVINGVCHGAYLPDMPQQQYQQRQLQPLGGNVYQNQYGQPVRVVPQGGGYGEQLQVQPNAYGNGVGMDQYGRPVRQVPAW